MRVFGGRYGEWFVILCIAILWFGTLHYRHLISPDEGRYAEIAREMAQGGDWITPHLNGLKYFEKPALQYWCSAFFFRIMGLSEFAARLWPALTGFLAAFFIGFVACRIWNKETGKIATLVLISCMWWIGNGHFLTLDMGLSAFLAISMGSFLIAQRVGATDREVCLWMLVSWGAAALAALSKGLIGIIIPGATLVLYSVWQWDWRLWTKLHLGKGMLLFFTITAPWFILVSWKNPGFAHFFFIEEHFLRYATDTSGREGPIYYFVFVLLGGLVPWLSFLPQALKQISYQRTAQFSPEKFLLTWTVFIFVFFSLSQSKLPSYILPLFPAVALLIARFLQSANAQVLRLHAWLLILPALILWLAAWVMYLLPANMDRMLVNQSFSPWLFIGGVVFMLCALGAICCIKRTKKWGMLLYFASAGLLALQIPVLGHQSYSSQLSGYFLSEKIKPYLQPEMPIYIVGFYDQTLPFYLQRTIKLVDYRDEFTMGLNLEPENKISLAQFIARWKNEKNAIAIMERHQYQQLHTQGMPMKVIAVADNELAVAHHETH